MREQRLVESWLPWFRDRVESLMARKGRPLLLGEMALEAGCSLEQARREVDRLEQGGVLARVEDPELLRRHGWEVGCLAYGRRRS